MFTPAVSCCCNREVMSLIHLKWDDHPSPSWLFQWQWCQMRWTQPVFQLGEFIDFDHTRTIFNLSGIPTPWNNLLCAFWMCFFSWSHFSRYCTKQFSFQDWWSDHVFVSFVDIDFLAPWFRVIWKQGTSCWRTTSCEVKSFTVRVRYLAAPKKDRGLKWPVHL